VPPRTLRSTIGASENSSFEWNGRSIEECGDKSVLVSSFVRWRRFTPCAYALLFMDWREDPVSSKLRISTLRMLPCAASLLWMEKNIHGQMGEIAPMQTRTHGLQHAWQTRTSVLPGKHFIQALVGYPVGSASAGLTRQHTVSQEHHVD